jgi:S1-C subfamily serine protease
MRVVAAAIFLIGFCLGQTTPSAEQQEFNTAMMESTFRIVGNNQAMGTGFIIGRPIPNSPRFAYVFVTAAHVLNDMNSDSATLIVRLQDAQKHWQPTPVSLQLRSSGRPLWLRHPSADVAVMYVRLPTGTIPAIVPETLLAVDEDFAKYDVHPGDDLNVLGYPLGAFGPSDFPILRSGRIASYPLIPAKENPYFLLDFRVFKGNSGGPAYLVSYNRTYGGATHLGASVAYVRGLVSEEIGLTIQTQELYETRVQTYPISVAKIVPSTLIRETVDMLPPPKEGQ